jgi:hypothetical protein
VLVILILILILPCLLRTRLRLRSGINHPKKWNATPVEVPMRKDFRAKGEKYLAKAKGPKPLTEAAWLP